MTRWCRTQRSLPLWLLQTSPVLIICIFSSIPEAFARAGGGSSYSGGSSGSGGSDSDGGGVLIYYFIRFLIELTFDYPLIGIPIDIVVIIVAIKLANSKKPSSDVVFASHSSLHNTPSSSQDFSSFDLSLTNQVSSSQDISTLDPSLSEVLFFDFIYTLYSQLQEARGRDALKDFSNFISPAVMISLGELSTNKLKSISGVIVGSCHIVNVTRHEKNVNIAVELEANYTETTENKNSQSSTSYYTQETWTFTHLLNTPSSTSAGTSTIPCPGCGAQSERAIDGSCPFCGVKTLTNRLGINAINVVVTNREEKGPLLTSTVPETGTEFPTIYQVGLDNVLRTYTKQNPDFSEDTFLQRAEAIFLAIQDAWSSVTWEKARPFESDCLFQTHRFWIEEYKKQRLRNVLADTSVTSKEIVRVTTDNLYEAITVRIFAQMKDSTITNTGELVCGDSKIFRKFSEYWTFIRKRTHKIQKGSDFMTCPSCGAQLNISMAGLCTYCKAKITSGDFDWVASRIEQDESYQ